jgi:hypothetical protein
MIYDHLKMTDNRVFTTFNSKCPKYLDILGILIGFVPNDDRIIPSSQAVHAFEGYYLMQQWLIL